MAADDGRTTWPVAVGWLLTSVVLGLALLGLLPASQEEWRVAGLAVAATGFFGFLVFVLRRLLGQDRQRALARLCRRRGLSLDPQRAPWREAWQTDFDLFTRRIPIERWNVLTGTWRQMAVEAFDYSYRIQAASDEETDPPSSHTVAVITLTQELPAVIIEPNRTNAPSPKGSFITWYGAVDGEAELSDFQRRYVVLAEDNRAARRLVHADMETFLMKHWGISVQTVGHRAVFYGDRLLQPNELGRLLDVAAGFCERIPIRLIPDDPEAEQEPSVDGNA
ncbi:MAG: hypothetical protein JW889_08550 [Verrucomicrobia bacterium]|nr:hypothetical protein [Verrucomicrobiota bacterium]